LVCGIGPSAADTTKNRTVHLSRTGNHVLDEVGVARAVDVGVVPIFRLVLDVSHGDRDRLGVVTHRTALGDIRVRLKLSHPLGSLDRQNRAGQSVVLPWSM
jgi:hypothetical protein